MDIRNDVEVGKIEIRWVDSPAGTELPRRVVIIDIVEGPFLNPEELSEELRSDLQSVHQLPAGMVARVERDLFSWGASNVSAVLEFLVQAGVAGVIGNHADRQVVVWAGQAAIAQAAGWGSDRTARRWLRAAEARGWVAVEHRCDRRLDGTVRALTNLTVVVLPAEVEARRVARKGAGKGHGTPRAPQNRALSREAGESRPVPPMVTPSDATAVVLPERPEPPTTGPGAVLAARVLRMARHGP